MHVKVILITDYLCRIMENEEKILVVQNPNQSMDLVKYHLQKMGFTQVIESENAESALRMLVLEKVELILSDWEMDGMNGLEFFSVLQKKDYLKGVPFILITDANEKERILEAKKAGIIHCLIKPFSVDVFQAKIYEILGDGTGGSVETRPNQKTSSSS